MLPKLLCGSFVLANPRHPSAILVPCKKSSTTSKIFLRNICVNDIFTRLLEYLNPFTSTPLQATQCVFCIFCQIDWIPRFFPHHHCQQFCHLVIFISNTSKRLIRYLFDCFFSNITCCNKQTPFRSIKMFFCPRRQMLTKSAPHKAHNTTKQNSRQNCVNLVRTVLM